jgi:hypothetical protein
VKGGVVRVLRLLGSEQLRAARREQTTPGVVCTGGRNHSTPQRLRSWHTGGGRGGCGGWLLSAVVAEAHSSHGRMGRSPLRPPPLAVIWLTAVLFACCLSIVCCLLPRAVFRVACFDSLLPAKGGAFGAPTRRPSGSGGISQQPAASS